MRKYGMYTDAGNARIDRVVEAAAREGWSWDQTQNYLLILAKHVPECRECCDTVVREEVYAAIEGFYA